MSIYTKINKIAITYSLSQKKQLPLVIEFILMVNLFIYHKTVTLSKLNVLQFRTITYFKHNSSVEKDVRKFHKITYYLFCLFYRVLLIYVMLKGAVYVGFKTIYLHKPFCLLTSYTPFTPMCCMHD